MIGIAKNCNMLQFFAMSSKYNKSRLAPTFIVDFSVKICYNKIKIIKRLQTIKNQHVGKHILKKTTNFLYYPIT